MLRALLLLYPDRRFALFLLLSYALLLSLVAPFAVGSTGTSGSHLLKRGAAPLYRPGQQEKTGRREGEVLVRFREGTSEQEKTAVMLARGARRGEQIGGESGVEKVDVPQGQSAESLAAQLLANPSVEFAEPNFLIYHDQTTPNDPRFTEQWALRNTGQGGGGMLFGSDIDAESAWEMTTGSYTTVIAV
ncbi:MAG TPA: hypothetical protein VGB17_13680, partial [Pyrinomonadaceae bacterium]